MRLEGVQLLASDALRRVRRHRDREWSDRRDHACADGWRPSPPRHAGARQCARPCPAALADLVRRRRQAARELAAAARRDAGDRPLSRRARRLRPRGARRRGFGDGPLHALPWARCRRSTKRARSRAPRPTSASASRFAVFMRDRNPLVYGAAAAVLEHHAGGARGVVEAQFLAPMPAPPSRSRASRRSPRRSRARPSPCSSGRAARNGARTNCSAPSRRPRRARAAACICICLETSYQRAFADRAYPEGVVRASRRSAFCRERLTLAHCVYARPEELDLIAAPRRDHRDQSELEPASALPESRRSARRSGAAAASRSASTPPRSTRTTTSCARCGSAISCMAAGASTASSSARLACGDRRQRPPRQRRAGRGRARGRRARRHSRARSRSPRPRRGHAGRADRSRVRARDHGACRAS